LDPFALLAVVLAVGFGYPPLIRRGNTKSREMIEAASHDRPPA
jgi:hypothetical protein